MNAAIPKVGFISLGCPKATYDSERILTQLRAEGYVITPDYQEAQLVVVNTCGFIDEAVAESLDAIGEALDENGKVVVTGCLGAKTDLIMEAYPEVLAVTGPDSLEQVMGAIHQHLPPQHDPYTDLVPPGGIKLTPRHYAYIKIAEGCNQRCSFCIIPSLRGSLHSRPPEQILGEAERLVEAGVKELLIVSQDTGAYGVDVKYKTGFWNGRPVKSRITDLARQLGGLGAWVRLHYLYPYPHVDELLPLMAEGLVLPYMDVPFQHASPPILKAMRRPGDIEGLLRRIEKWRQVVPDLALRSTFIVGFPGETEEDFQQLLTFIDEARLDRAGAFAYSPVARAAANALPNPVPEWQKEERLELFMERQAAVSADKLQDRVGTTETVLIDAIDGDIAVGRSAAEAPEIDGIIQIEGIERQQVGDFVTVKIESAGEHDLLGTITT